MPTKFQCHYKLTLNWIDNEKPMQAIVTDPVSINFTISKEIFQSTNSARIQIYNLDASTRESIYQDRILFDRTVSKWVTLEAGYGESLTLVCWGYIQQCFSEKNGVDFITTIDVLDPDILGEYTGVTFQPGTTFDEAYKYLVAQMPNLQIGECGQLEGEFKIPTVFDGNTFSLINKLTGGHTFVDNGVVNTLNNNETLSNYGVYLIAGETGLLDTPRRQESILEINMLFEPTIKMGQMVEIKSSTQVRFDGQYKVLGVTHNCLISGADGGTRTTSLQLQYIDYLINSNVNITNKPEGSSPSIVKNQQIEPINLKVDSEVTKVYNYILKNNGQVPKTKITSNITWWEMFYKGNNSPQNVKKQITLKYLVNCREIATRLTNFVNSNKALAGKPIIIHSGFRTTQTNTNTEGSADKSNHLTGSAIDFHIDGVSNITLHNIFKNSWRYGLGTYTWGLHISLNPKERFRGS